MTLTTATEAVTVNREPVKTPIRSAVIGAGGISAQHLTPLSEMAAGKGGPRVELVGVADLSPAMGKLAVDRFGAAKAFTDFRAMLDEAKPDVVHVLTPPHTHAMIAMACLEAGCHVFAEKPVTGTLAEYEPLAEAARERGLLLTESHNYLFNEAVRRIHSMVAAGEIGDVVEIETRMQLGLHEPGNPIGDANLVSPLHKMPAGAVHDLLTHLIYPVTRWMEGVESVHASWTNSAGKAHFRFDDLDAVVIGKAGDRASVASGEPGHQVNARIRFGVAGRPEEYIYRVVGTKGWVETNLFQPYLRRVLVERPGPEKLASLVNHAWNGMSLVRSSVTGFADKLMQRTPYHGLHGMVRETYRALAAGRPAPVEEADIRRSLGLIDLLVAQQAGAGAGRGGPACEGDAA